MWAKASRASATTTSRAGPRLRRDKESSMTVLVRAVIRAAAWYSTQCPNSATTATRARAAREIIQAGTPVSQASVIASVPLQFSSQVEIQRASLLLPSQQALDGAQGIGRRRRGRLGLRRRGLRRLCGPRDQ